MRRRLQSEGERVLLERARRDLAAFQDLYELYLSGVFTFVAYRVNRRHDIEGVETDSFLRATRRLDEFE